MATRNIVPRATGQGSLGTSNKRWSSINVDNAKFTNPLPISEGGTGANTASQACANIGALPLRGGYMIGDIYKANNNSALWLVGGAPTANARLGLFGKDYEEAKGFFSLAANNGVNESVLVGSPDGNLFWANKQIVRSVNGINADSNGNVGISNVDYANLLRTTTNPDHIFKLDWDGIGSFFGYVSAHDGTYRQVGVGYAGEAGGIHNGHWVIETYVNGTSWYRKWSDGWIEQGGLYVQTSTSATYDAKITFFKPFADTKYNIQLTKHSTTNNSPGSMYFNGAKTMETTNFTFNIDQIFYQSSMSWYAYGMGA